MYHNKPSAVCLLEISSVNAPINLILGTVHLAHSEKLKEGESKFLTHPLLIYCLSLFYSGIFHFFNNGFESSGIVESEVCENLTVDFDTCFVNQTHQF